MIDIACTICMQLDSCNYIDDAPTLNSIWYITFDEPHYIRANHITFEEPHYIHHIFHSVHFLTFEFTYIPVALHSIHHMQLSY